jgi:dihydrofolate reductase
MTKLVSEFIISLDGSARGTQSPAYYGFNGPEFSAWLGAKSKEAHRNLLGRETYELLSALPEKHRDDDYRIMAATPGWVASTRLARAEWPGLEIVRSDLCEKVAEWKSQPGSEIRTIGSLSLVRQLISAGQVDCLRLIVCPLVLSKTGIEPVFSGYPDVQFKLLDTRVLDGRVLVLDYQPDGPPPEA